MNKRQQLNMLKKVRRTLTNIDEKKFWERVLRRHSKKVDAHDQVRFKSFAAAHTKVMY